MTTPDNDVTRCPKCGAARRGEGADLLFMCGSVDEWRLLPFKQSDTCQIAELQRTVAKLTEERDAAIHLLSQYNSNQGGLLLNGKSIGWHRDPVVGFVAGIGGGKTVYPTILEAIRAAIATTKGGGV